MVTGRNYYNDPIALESFGGGMIFYSMASPILRDDDGQRTSPVIRTTFPESWIFDTEFDNG